MRPIGRILLNMNKQSSLSSTVAARIRAVVAAKRLTVSTVSGFLNISVDAVKRRLRGEVEFSLSQIEAFAEYTGYQPEAFLDPQFVLTSQEVAA